MKAIIAVVMLAGASVVAIVPTTAGATRTPVHGDLQCIIGPGPLNFDPPAIYYTDRNLAPSAHRGASHVTFVASLSACRGTTAITPGPGGIDHGTVEIKAALGHHDCANLDEMKPKFTLTLLDATGARVVKRSFKTTTTIKFGPPSADVPWTFTFTGTATRPTAAFGGETLRTTHVTDGGILAHFCQSDGLASWGWGGGTISIGNPT